MQENVTYHKHLVKLADELGLKSATTKTVVTALKVPDDIEVLFLLSVPNTLKDMLLKSAKLLVYTPSNEHFGIVPLEAMLAGVPVLAANSGGPLESVVDGVTGWLCPPEKAESWTVVMDMVLHKMSDEKLEKMGMAGRDRVKQEFSDVKMAERIDGIIDEMAGIERKKVFPWWILTIPVVILDAGYWVSRQAKGTVASTLQSKVNLVLAVLATVALAAYYPLAFLNERQKGLAAKAKPTRQAGEPGKPAK